MVRAEFLADSAASFTIMTAPVAPEGPAGAFGGYTLLDGLRTASKSWFGKAIMTLVFGVIIVSFAIWGIGDIFRGFGTRDKWTFAGAYRDKRNGVSVPFWLAAAAA